MFLFILYALVANTLLLPNIGCNNVDSNENFDEIAPEGLIVDTINKTIQAIKDIIDDPMIIDVIEINSNTDLLNGGANVSDLTITGLKGFLVPYLDVHVFSLQLSFTFVFPAININTKYWGDLLVANLVPLYGSGKANINLENIVLNGSGQADLSDGLTIKNLVIVIAIGDAVFDIHGMLNNEDFSLMVSAILNDVVAKFINEHQELITSIASPIVETIINALLHANSSTTAAPSTTTPPSTTIAPETPTFIKLKDGLF